MSVRVPSQARTRVATAGSSAWLTEAEFQRQVTDLAEILGWHTRTRDTSIVLPGLAFHPQVAYRSEPGWPDLTMVRRRDRRIVFAELKLDKATSRLTPRQTQVLDLLRCLESDQVAVRVWRPSDWADIEATLR